MLPNYFKSLNSFGIDGDIFCTFNTVNDGQLMDISFYNTNPNKTYEFIDFPFNFGTNIISQLKWPDAHADTHSYISGINNLNFYNFNQDKLKLVVHNPIGFLANTYFFKKFNFNGDIELVFDGSYNFNYFNCFDYNYANTIPNENQDMSNVIINFFGGRSHDYFYSETLGSESSAKYMFYTSDYFNPLKKFKQIDIPFLYFDDLTYCFGFSDTQRNMGFGTKINLTLSDLLIPKDFNLPDDPMVTNIDFLTNGRLLENNYYIDHPEGFIGTNISFPKLESAGAAFESLEFKKIDIENLLNAIPTKTDNKEHYIGVGYSSNNPLTSQEIDEYINQYNQKGWTLSIDAVG